jgi:site-specific DNA recombinase
MLKFLDQCKKKVIVLVHDLDRFSRTGANAINIRKELESKGYFVQGVSDPVKLGTLNGKIQQDNQQMDAEHINMRRYQKCRIGIEAKLLDGGWVGKVPFGYYREYPKGGRKREVYVDEIKAKIVKDVFEWYAYEKLTYSAISLRLQMGGTRLSLQAIGAMLKNVFYTGYVSHGILEGKVVKGKHKPIISQELFGLVNGFLGENQSGFTHKRDNNTVPLKGFCTCGLCGYGFTGYDIEKAGKTYSYYKCQKNCSEITISAPRLHELFIEKLKSYEINPVLIPVIKKQVVATFLQLTEKDIVQEKILKTQLADEKRKFNILKQNLGQGVVPRDVYDELEPGHREKISQIEVELSKMSYDSSNLENQVQVALEAASNLLNFWNLLDYRWRQRLQRLVFPSGMSYFKNNNEVLTPDVNPIFTEIARVAKELEAPQIAMIGETQEISSILSQSFASSNFIWDGLLLIIDFIKELKGNSPTIFNSAIYHHIVPISGVIQNVKYDYISTTSGATQKVLQLPFTGATESHTIIPSLLFSGNSTLLLSISGQS